jgi:hypothetical protein
VTPGATSAPGVHRTTTPLAPKYEVTLVGALGNENVFACAVGISNETNNAMAVASAPKPVNFLEIRVCFMALSKHHSISHACFLGNDMVTAE